MNKKLALGLASLLAAVALAVMPVVAQAETKTLVSSAANSLCISPKAFKTFTGNSVNYAPLTKPHAGPFPDTGSACNIPTPSHAIAMGPPSAPAGPFSGAIPGASWVSQNATGETSVKPVYFIFDETFRLCQNQVSGATIQGTMFADNVAGAFLNGQPIGNQPFNPPTAANFNGPPTGGWAFGPATGPFKTGLNTLQFVVFSGADFTGLEDVGLDFSATVTSKCPIGWYSNGKLLPPNKKAQTVSWGELTLKPTGGQLKEGERVSVATSGTLTLEHVLSEESHVTCTVNDKETIENPIGGGAGKDSFGEFALSSCFIAKEGHDSAFCGAENPEVIAKNLSGWSTRLIAGSPPKDEITGIELEVKCAHEPFHQTFTGTLTPTLSNSVLTFGAGSGELQQQGEPVTSPVIGTDALTGPPGEEDITATSSEPPHWSGSGGSEAQGVTCKKSDAGNVWNPEGGDAGLDGTVLFDLYECRSAQCPKGVSVTASGMPWPSELEEVPAGSNVIRDRTTGITVTINCEGRESVFTGEWTPRFRNGTAAKPSFEEFGEGSGELVSASKEGPNLKVTGYDKMVGFEEGDEVITAKATKTK